MFLIEAKNLAKSYGEEIKTHALKDASFSIKKGEFVAIMGPSGSGKSTLLHILGMLDRESGGKYIFNGKDVNKFTDNERAKLRNEELGFVFQSFNLLPKTTVYNNVLLPLLYSGIPESKWKKMTEEAIESVGLTHRRDHESGSLSGGEKQRVAIARALVTNPNAIFADEPTGNLDTESGRNIMQIIEDLNKKGHTIILITHESLTAEYAERIIRIRDGKVESDEKTQNRRTSVSDFKK